LGQTQGLVLAREFRFDPDQGHHDLPEVVLDVLTRSPSIKIWPLLNNAASAQTQQRRRIVHPISRLKDIWRKLSHGDVIYSRQFLLIYDSSVRGYMRRDLQTSCRKSAQANSEGGGLYSIDVKTVHSKGDQRDINISAYSAKDGHTLFTRAEAILELVSLEKSFEAAGLRETAWQPSARQLAVNAAIVDRFKPAR
jgi:hypothetical protein